MAAANSYSGQILTGNDVVIFEGADGSFEELKFTPLVDIEVHLGMGYLIDVIAGIEVVGTPTADFDYQDSIFEAMLASMVRYMRSVNA